jgi:RNA polymerase sigma-70 factor (ECF subfamily)
MNRDPEQLARGLQAGSAEAWHELYDAFAEAVWRCVARRVGPHAAEVADIVQETFLAAARSARTFDPARGSLWSWLCGIARRQAALHFRRKQTRPVARGDGAVGNALRGVPDSAANGTILDWLDGRAAEPADLLAAAETAAAVRQVLAELPLDYEMLLVGKYMDGLSLEELAEDDDSTAVAVSSKLARARRAFREAFEKLVGPPERESIGTTA